METALNTNDCLSLVHVNKELINAPTMSTFAAMMLQKLRARVRFCGFLSCVLGFWRLINTAIYYWIRHLYDECCFKCQEKRYAGMSTSGNVYEIVCEKFLYLRDMAFAWIYIRWELTCRLLYRIEGPLLFSLINSMITYRKLGGVRVERGRRGRTGQRGVRRRRHPVRRTALAHTCKDEKQVKMWRFFYDNTI